MILRRRLLCLVLAMELRPNWSQYRFQQSSDGNHAFHARHRECPEIMHLSSPACGGGDGDAANNATAAAPQPPPPFAALHVLNDALVPIDIFWLDEAGDTCCLYMPAQWGAGGVGHIQRMSRRPSRHALT